MSAQGSRQCTIEYGGHVLNGAHLVGTKFSKGFCGRWVQQGVGEVTGGLYSGITGGSF